MQRFVATKFLGRFEDSSGLEGDFAKSLSGLGKWLVTEFTPARWRGRDESLGYGLTPLKTVN
jgi:hypothetical protein